jgi:hypothetical protein
MLPVYNSPYGGWAACGEIDLMETICESLPSYATIHYGGAFPNNTQWPWPPYNEFPMNVNWSEPHNYGVEWQPTYFRFWFDALVVDQTIQGQDFGYIPADQWFSANDLGERFPGNAPFDQPFNIILNIAIGGNWACQTSGCCSNVESVMPSQMVVNFVQVYQAITQVQ